MRRLPPARSLHHRQDRPHRDHPPPPRSASRRPAPRPTTAGSITASPPSTSAASSTCDSSTPMASGPSISPLPNADACRPAHQDRQDTSSACTELRSEGLKPAVQAARAAGRPASAAISKIVLLPRACVDSAHLIGEAGHRGSSKPRRSRSARRRAIGRPSAVSRSSSRRCWSGPAFPGCLLACLLPARLRLCGPVARAR